MATSMGQAVLGTTAAALICQVPPGAWWMLTSNEISGGTIPDVYIATGSMSPAVMGSAGCPFAPYSPVNLRNPPQSPAFQLWGATTSDSHVVGWIVVTDR